MIVIGTTMAAFAMSREDAWRSWLLNSEEIMRISRVECEQEVRYFAALQLDARGVEPFRPLLDELTDLGGEHWTYSLDDGREVVDMTNRWRHITFGQNMVMDRCQADKAVDHLLFLAADTEVPRDIIPKMLEMNHPLCAPFISTYGLRGPRVTRYRYPVEEAMASAAAIFMSRPVFRALRWRWDLDAGMSDDPCFHHDALHLHGIPTLVRHDCQAEHHPRSIGAYDTRFDPDALKVQR